MPSNLIVYKASAGSGKTFTLAIQYIKALVSADSRNAYSKILAVTFTNKATTEMKDRILQQLYGIWRGLDSSAGYRKALQQELQADGIVIDDAELSRRAGEALGAILHDYGRFRVETIDTFFQSVMKNLAHEMNLTANLKVDLNDEEVLNAAVDRIMGRLHLMPKVLGWMLEYINDRITNNERWNISREVKDFGRWIFKEAYLTHERELREKLGDEGTLAAFRQSLRELQERSADIVQSGAAHFNDMMEHTGLGLDRIKNGSRSLRTYLNTLLSGDTSAEFKTTLQQYTDNPLNMLKKADQGQADLVRAAAELSSLLQELETLRQAAHRQQVSARIAGKHLNPLRLLGTIDEEVNRMNNESNRFLLANTPLLLNALIEEHDAPFIYEKMGSVIAHVMIDEFQDTSSMQWRNFRVLLNESLAAGQQNLLVGDIKQSIYRWRNGDWTILNNIGQEMKPFAPEIRTLQTNYRSERRVVAFNNALFERAATLLDEAAPDARLKIAEAYADVSQRCPEAKGEGGHVSLTLYQPASRDTDVEGLMLDELCHTVQAYRQQGLPLNEMAILIRKRRHAAPIIEHFAQQLPDCRIVSDEAFLLSGSTAVQVLIAALTCLHDPTNHIAAAYLYLYCHPEDGLAQLPQARHTGTLIPKVLSEQRGRLIAMPLYELNETLYKLLHLQQVEGEDAYLFAYFDHLTAYTQENPADIGSFLRYWEEVMQYKSIPSGEVDGIRIFTIHKSKGLQFHTVLIPYCDWDIEKDKAGLQSKNDLLWCSCAQEPFDRLPVIPAAVGKDMSESVFADYYHEEHLQRRVDALNLLYVAFTRAEKNLHAWCTTTGTLSPTSGVGDLILQALPTTAGDTVQEEDEQGLTTRYTCGTPEVTAVHTASRHDNRMEMAYDSHVVQMHSHEARIDFVQSNRAEEFIESMHQDGDGQGRTNRRRLGVLLHRLFSTIYTETDADKALCALEGEGLIASAEEREELQAQLRRALSHPDVQGWFDGSMRLYNECPILTKEYHSDTGKYATYRPDRVMIDDSRVIVVDFKFGRPDTRYADQVAHYMKLLRQMEPEKDATGYLWYVTDNRIEAINA